MRGAEFLSHLDADLFAPEVRLISDQAELEDPFDADPEDQPASELPSQSCSLLLLRR